MLNIKNKSLKNFDFILFFTTLILCIYGLIIIRSATLTMGPEKYLRSQIGAMIIGFTIIFLFYFIDHNLLGKFYIPIYIVSNLLLILVLVRGIGVNEDWVARWVKIGPITFQPSEFAKIGIIISLAKLIDNNREDINNPYTLLKILAFGFLPILLIFRQPDAGTALVFIVFKAVMLFIAGLKWKYIFYTLSLALISLPFLWLSLKPYQRNRIFDFLNPYRDPTGTGYQAIQGLIAIGSGKLFGRGLYQGVQTQYNYIPEKQNDFIFSVLVEELGFLGGFALIVLYSIFLYRFIQIARKTKDFFVSTMVIGLAAMNIFHIWQNMGMTMGIMPITGVPLPFISHGGTFLLINLIGVAIALSVSSAKDRLNF